MKQLDGAADLAIEAAVTHWRAGVRGLEGRELDELADHVASSARTLMEGKLAPDEAVLIAARRLGAERELVREFERGDGRLRWSDPRGLLLLGAALGLVAKPLLTLPAHVASMLFRSAPGWTSGTIWLPTLVTSCVTLGVLLVLVRARSASALLERIRHSPRTTAVCFVVALLAPSALALFDLWALERGAQVTFTSGYVWSATIASTLVFFVLPIALLALAHRRLRQPLPE
jgi:hypothetical protein